MRAPARLPFPAVAPTEFGSDCDYYAATQCRDFNYLRDAALYMNNAGATTTYPHTQASVWYWWCWNANSGGTGGIVTSADVRSSDAWRLGR